MTNVENLYPTADERIAAMKGPQAAGYKVIVEGRAIRRLTMLERDADITLIVDGRFAVDVPREIATSVAWLVANALAVGEGYPCLSAESKTMPFAPICSRLDMPAGVP